MSNEAGQGTITMPAAASDAKHPCDQGCVQAVGVFLDTMVICTLTGFVVVMGRVWQTDASAEWFDASKLYASDCLHLHAFLDLCRLRKYAQTGYHRKSHL